MQSIPALIQPVRIVLADDHDLVRSAIKALLVQIPGVTVVARDGWTERGSGTACAISPVATWHRVRAQHRGLHQARSGKRCLRLDLTKDASPFELGQAIRSVMANGSYFNCLIARRLLQPAEPAASKTVDVHRRRLMERLDLHDISSLTRYAIRKKLIDA